MASYLHCDSCRRAFDVRVSVRCPTCDPPTEALEARIAELERTLAAVHRALEEQRALTQLPAPRSPEISVVDLLRRRVRETRTRALGLVRRLLMA